MHVSMVTSDVLALRRKDVGTKLTGSMSADVEVRSLSPLTGMTCISHPSALSAGKISLRSADSGWKLHTLRSGISALGIG